MLSIELVPRELRRLLQEAAEIAAEYPQFTWLNIPDIKSLPVRSHDAALAARELPLRVIPHVRARDRSVAETLAIFERLGEAGIGDILIVTGDRFGNGEEVDHATSLDVLREAVAQFGGAIKFWAAFDPYRSELRAELDYAKAKLDAGAAGFFTQPFFDLRFAEICLDQLAGIDTFVGISPVTSDKSRAYWERTNRVVFPKDFVPTLDYCARLTADLLHMTESHGQHAYLMPIRVDAKEYIQAAFSHARAAGAMSSSSGG